MELRDDRETTFDMEPLIPEEASRHRPALEDLALELATASAALSASVPGAVREPLARLMRAAGCYFSNLIEGHDCHPVDIERAMNGKFSADPARRNLQLEAVAHVEVHRWLDEGGLAGHPLAQESLREIHRRFCEGLPGELLVQESPEGMPVPTVPGQLRAGFVQIGSHMPPSPGAVPRLLGHMHRMYRMQGRCGGIIAAACAHHRLVWVHPFADMNGRVSRLVAQAMLSESAGSGGMWSVSRGLARNVGDYMARLAAADAKRPGGADGRGALSEARLAEFATFFLRSCIGEIGFMSALMRPAGLRCRIMEWAQREEREGRALLGSDRLLCAILEEGELARGAVPGLLGVSDCQAEKITSGLLELEAISSDGPKSPLRQNLPASLASAWMPDLFPAWPG